MYHLSHQKYAVHMQSTQWSTVGVYTDITYFAGKYACQVSKDIKIVASEVTKPKTAAFAMLIKQDYTIQYVDVSRFVPILGIWVSTEHVSSSVLEPSALLQIIVLVINQ